MSEGREFLVALNRNLLDSTALAGAMPANLRSAASVYSQAQIDAFLLNYYTSTQADVLLALKAANGANSDITSLAGLTTPLSAAQGGTGVASMTALTAALDAFVGDSGAGGTKGLVPAPAAGDAAAVKFLKANGTWAVTPSADIAGSINAATGKTPPVDADEFGIVDSAAANVLKKLTWANLKATLKTYFDTLYQPLAAALTSIAGLTPTNDDVMQYKSGAWANRTLAQLKTDLSLQPLDATLTSLAAYNTNGLLTQTAADTFTGRTITGTANEIDVANGDGVSANPTLTLPTVAKPYGKQAVPIPAGAMKSRTTNGAAAGTAEMTTNKNMFVTLDFDASTQEFAQFSIAMPKSWDEGTVTFQPIWSHASTTTNFGVVWSLAGVAISDDDAGDVAFGTVQTSTDTGGTTNDVYIGPESAAITIAGTPAAQDWVMFQIARVPADGSDTMAIDARLHGITLYMSTNAGNDA